MLISVKNRNNGNTGYTLSDGGIIRQFLPGETKQLEKSELEQLMFQPGGKYILENYLIIQDQNIVSELLGEVEPEYNYTEAEIKELLLNGSEDQLKDCLDFAPDGVKELIKQMAVDMKLNDMRKRRIIGDYFSFDINGAIEFREENEKEESSITPIENKRRSTPINTVTSQKKIIITR